jgi:S-adenosylmethionine synthetase
MDLRVAAETLTNTGFYCCLGRNHHQCACRLHPVAHDTIKRIGYDNTDYGID